MSIVFHFDGTEALRKKVEAHGVTLCPESDDAAFARLLPEVEVLWHVLKPVTADLIALPPTHPLLALRNVVAVPHLAWLTQETLERSTSIALRNVGLLQSGKPLLHRVV